jgi:hypothetical protein
MLLAKVDTLTLVQTVILGVSVLIAFLTVRAAGSQYREARAERRLRDVENRLARISDCIIDMTEAAGLSLQPPREGALGLVRFNVGQDHFRAALAALKPVGRRLPQCEKLIGVQAIEMLTTASVTALDEVSAEIMRVHLEGPPSLAEIRTLALIGDPPSPLDWTPTV